MSLSAMTRTVITMLNVEWCAVVLQTARNRISDCPRDRQLHSHSTTLYSCGAYTTTPLGSFHDLYEMSAKLSKVVIA